LLDVIVNDILVKIGKHQVEDEEELGKICEEERRKDTCWMTRRVKDDCGGP